MITIFHIIRDHYLYLFAFYAVFALSYIAIDHYTHEGD